MEFDIEGVLEPSPEDIKALETGSLILETGFRKT